MITLTAAAGEKIKRYLDSRGKAEGYLRVFVAPGGCSGFTYGMSVEDAPVEGDAVVESEGVKILVDPGSAEFLAGAEIDYVEGLMGGGFAIHNPNAVATCGCGSSFRTARQAGRPEACS